MLFGMFPLGQFSWKAAFFSVLLLNFGLFKDFIGFFTANNALVDTFISVLGLLTALVLLAKEALRLYWFYLSGRN